MRKIQLPLEDSLPENLLRAETARWFVNDMVMRGIPVTKLLRGTALKEGWLDDKEALISPDDYLQIVRNALDESGDPALGLSIGNRQSFTDFGITGYAIISSASIWEAAQIAVKYWGELSGSLVKPILFREDEVATWEIYPAFPIGEKRLLIFAVEEYLSNMESTRTFLYGEDFPIHDIHVTYSEPAHVDLYREIFDCPVFFESDKNRLRVETRFLDIPLRTADRQFAEVCRQQCDKMLLKLHESGDFVNTIRRALISARGDFPKLDDMAKQLVLSPRTLRRKLSERGTSYQMILDEVRIELAKEYLSTTSLSIDQISDLIGFSEATTFRRAFKKWTGQSAAEFRKKGEAAT